MHMHMPAEWESNRRKERTGGDEREGAFPALTDCRRTWNGTGERSGWRSRTAAPSMSPESHSPSSHSTGLLFILRCSPAPSFFPNTTQVLPRGAELCSSSTTRSSSSPHLASHSPRPVSALLPCHERRHLPVHRRRG